VGGRHWLDCFQNPILVVKYFYDIYSAHKNLLTAFMD
jgi:hypothetical protein